MEKVTQTTAATAEESAAASEELNAQAEASLGVVRQLEQLVGGAAGVAGATHAPATKKAGRVVAMRQKPAATPAPRPMSAEDELPLADTGTYGRF